MGVLKDSLQKLRESKDSSGFLGTDEAFKKFWKERDWNKQTKKKKREAKLLNCTKVKKIKKDNTSWFLKVQFGNVAGTIF